MNIQEIKDKYRNFGWDGLCPYEREQLVLDSIKNDDFDYVLMDEEILFGQDWGRYKYETETEAIGRKYLEKQVIFRREDDGTYWAISYDEDQRSQDMGNFDFYQVTSEIVKSVVWNRVKK